MTFHNEELQKTSSLNFVFSQFIACLATRKKGLIRRNSIIE